MCALFLSGVALFFLGGGGAWGIKGGFRGLGSLWVSRDISSGKVGFRGPEPLRCRTFFGALFVLPSHGRLLAFRVSRALSVGRVHRRAIF